VKTSFTETYTTTTSVNFIHCLILKKQCYVSGTGLVNDIHQVTEWGDNYFAGCGRNCHSQQVVHSFTCKWEQIQLLKHSVLWDNSQSRNLAHKHYVQYYYMNLWQLKFYRSSGTHIKWQKIKQNI